MSERHDSQVQFEEQIEISELEHFIRKLRKQTEMKDLALLHIVMAASVRMYSQKPSLNRFVVGRKIFARNSMNISLVVKKAMTEDSEETVIKPQFEPDDTLLDIYKKVDSDIIKNKSENNDNGAEKISKILGSVPTWLLAMTVGGLKSLDAIGFMPKFINELSPFHSSLFITNMGSTGIGAVYHHLYDFGTCSLFVCIGKKETILKKQLDGTIKEVRTVNIRVVVDERICDGYYYAVAFREFKKLLKNPELLLEKPKNIYFDTGLDIFSKN